VVRVVKMAGGAVPVFDVEMEGPDHNFIANGIVSHNSHSVCYGVISYWQMWLKTHYLAEFYYGLLKHEPDTDAIARFAKRARKEGVEIRAADVNLSSSGWSISDDPKRQVVVGGLQDLKGVGPKTTEAIEEAHPFKSFSDFCARTDRRRVNKRVVSILVRAGAFKELVPNPGWLIDNIDSVWGIIQKAQEGWAERMDRIIELSAAAPKWSADRLQDAASEITPLGFTKHPLERYESWLKKLPVKWLPMASEDFWEQTDAWLYGQVLELRYNQIGDFHSGTEPGADEKLRMGWGKRYATMNLEDLTDVQHRIRVEPDTFLLYRAIVDQGKGAFLACHVSINKQYRSLKADFLMDMKELYQRGGEAAPRDWRERLLSRSFVLPEGKGLVRPKTAGVSRGVIAIVARVTKKIDRNGNEMAFVGLFDRKRQYAEGVMFHGIWREHGDAIRPGAIGRWVLKTDGPQRDRNMNWVVEGFELVEEQ